MKGVGINLFFFNFAKQIFVVDTHWKCFFETLPLRTATKFMMKS